MQHMRSVHGIPGKIFKNAAQEILIPQKLNTIMKRQDQLRGTASEGMLNMYQFFVIMPLP